MPKTEHFLPDKERRWGKKIKELAKHLGVCEVTKRVLTPPSFSYLGLWSKYRSRPAERWAWLKVSVGDHAPLLRLSWRAPALGPLTTWYSRTSPCSPALEVKLKLEADMMADVPWTEATSRPVFTSGAIRRGNVSTRRTAVPDTELPSVTRRASFELDSPPSTYLLQKLEKNRNILKGESKPRVFFKKPSCTTILSQWEPEMRKVCVAEEQEMRWDGEERLRERWWKGS